MPSKAPKLLCFCTIIFHYITIILIIFVIIAIIAKQFFFDLGWNSLQKSGQSHHPSREIGVCSSQQQHGLNRGAPTCHLPQHGRHRPRRLLGSYDGCMKAIQYAWQDETDHPSHQRIWQSTSSCPATRDPQVQDPDEPENKAYNKFN